jgi:hypothetical protein
MALESKRSKSKPFVASAMVPANPNHFGALPFERSPDKAEVPPDEACTLN